MRAAGNRSILIVEDDWAVREMMKDVLEIEGYRVFSSHDGNDGINKLKRLTPKPTAVVLDLMMPGSNGWDFLDVQRSDPELAKIPVIVCSAYKESAKSIRPHAIIEKPMNLDDILNVVKEICDEAEGARRN